MKNLNQKEICEIIRINSENYFKLETLAGYCGLCSVAASLAFTRYGYKNTLCIGEFRTDCGSRISRHSWLESNNKVYDITAEQFNPYGFKYNRVHVGKPTKRYENKIRLENPSLNLILKTFRDEYFGNEEYLENKRLSNCLTGIMELNSLLAA